MNFFTCIANYFWLVIRIIFYYWYWELFFHRRWELFFTVSWIYFLAYNTLRACDWGGLARVPSRSTLRLHLWTLYCEYLEMDKSVQLQIREIANNAITEISRISQLVNSTHTAAASKSDLYPVVEASFPLQTLGLIHYISHLQAAQSVFLQMTYSLMCMTMLLVAHTLELFSRFQWYCRVNNYVFCYQKALFRNGDYKFELKPML